MKEQIVSYNVAKLAFEKDFKLWCNERYNLIGKIEKSPWPPVRYKANKEPVKADVNQIFAPTQSLLQQWLRNTYDIHIVITGYGDGEKFVAYQGEVVSYLVEEEIEENEIFLTYEQALEYSLEDALNLIK